MKNAFFPDGSSFVIGKVFPDGSYDSQIESGLAFPVIIQMCPGRQINLLDLTQPGTVQCTLFQTCPMTLKFCNDRSRDWLYCLTSIEWKLWLMSECGKAPVPVHWNSATIDFLQTKFSSTDLSQLTRFIQFTQFTQFTQLTIQTIQANCPSLTIHYYLNYRTQSLAPLP